MQNLNDAKNLKINWLVISKLRWRIWRILAWALENLKKLHFNGLVLTKAYNVWGKIKNRGNMFDGTEYWCKIRKKTDLAFKHDMRNLANFHQSMFESLKLGLWWDPFIQSRKCMSLKFTGEFCVMTMKNDAKFEEELTCQFKIDMRNLTNFDLSTRKSQKFAL